MKTYLSLAALTLLPLLGGCIGYPGQGSAYPGYGYGASAPGYAGYNAPPPAPYGGYDPRRDQAASGWYLDHPVEREAQLMQCRQSLAVAGDARCMAAIQADQQELSRERATDAFAPRAYGSPVILGPIVTPQIR